MRSVGTWPCSSRSLLREPPGLQAATAAGPRLPRKYLRQSTKLLASPQLDMRTKRTHFKSKQPRGRVRRCKLQRRHAAHGLAGEVNPRPAHRTSGRDPTYPSTFKFELPSCLRTSPREPWHCTQRPASQPPGAKPGPHMPQLRNKLYQRTAPM